MRSQSGFPVRPASDCACACAGVYRLQQGGLLGHTQGPCPHLLRSTRHQEGILQPHFSITRSLARLQPWLSAWVPSSKAFPLKLCMEVICTVHHSSSGIYVIGLIGDGMCWPGAGHHRRWPQAAAHQENCGAGRWPHGIGHCHCQRSGRH